MRIIVSLRLSDRVDAGSWRTTTWSLWVN